MFTMEITRLIERCRQGDADALGELYKAYAQRMRGVCRRYHSRGDIAVGTGTWGIAAVIPKYLLPLHPIIEIVPFS